MMNMIVAYDIADPKRLSRIAKLMVDYGVRVQKSIFELHINQGVFENMKARIEFEMDLEEDGVKYYFFCEKCAGTKEVIGQGVWVDPDAEYLII